MTTAYNYNTKNQKQILIGTIAGLVKELYKLAPHPDCPQYKGPLFIKTSPHFKPADDRESMLGSMILEGVLGAAFSEAVSTLVNDAAEDLGLPEINMPNIDISNVMDCYEEYISDIEGKREDKELAAKHGQGTMARMSGKSLSASFNMRSSISEGLQAFYDDLPKRMMIEKNMAYYAQQLDVLENTPEYAYTASRHSPIRIAA